MPSNIVDIQTGRRSKPWGVSKTHGRWLLPMVQTMSITDEQGVTIVDEFDNPDPVFSIREYNGAKASVEWIHSDQKIVESVLMDVDPNAAGPMTYEGDQLAPVDIMINDTGKNSGKIYSGKLLVFGQQSASTDAEDTKSPEKNTIGLDFLKLIRVKGGGAIQYTRFVNTPVYPTSDDVAFAGSVGTFPTAAKAMPQTDGTTKIVLHAKFNGNPIFDTTKFVATTSTFTPKVAPTIGDIWEVYSVIQP